MIDVRTVPHERAFAFHPADPDRARTLTPEQVAAYDRDGFLTGLPAFDAAEIAEICAYFDRGITYHSRP